MATVNCMYCGKAIAEDVAQCPHCGAVSHFQQRGYRAGARIKFVLWFAVLVGASFLLAFWLPR